MRGIGWRAAMGLPTETRAEHAVDVQVFNVRELREVGGVEWVQCVICTSRDDASDVVGTIVVREIEMVTIDKHFARIRWDSVNGKIAPFGGW